eukprot:TRINITY_DN4542_c0_g1_i1.p1 TRINITY_DN4542_c0_g1~~TRINITY_DN4542_c0_g1_i1.p1  ORF type:complete len:793 (+),score=125.36 TRINITY_DN4542_c0_g1_i1:344-2722(+)
MSSVCAASPRPHPSMFERISTMYKKYMLDAHVAQWLHLRRSVADFRGLHAQTSILLSVRPLQHPHSAHSAPQFPHNHHSFFPTADDLIFVDHTHNNFVLGHIWGDLSTETHPYASLSSLLGKNGWHNASVRSRKFAADTSVPNAIETVEYVWFHDERAIVILSLTTFEPGQPIRHCSEVVFYAPATSENDIILNRRPELVLRLSRQDICIECNASFCQCSHNRRQSQGNTATTTTSEHSVNDIDHHTNHHHQSTADQKHNANNVLPPVAARWRRTFRTIFAGRRHGTLTLHTPATNDNSQISYSYELLTRGGRALTSRIQLHILSRMPRTPPPPPPLALPVPPPPQTLPLGALSAPAAPPTLCGNSAKQNCDCSAERMPDNSLARILNSGHDHQQAPAQCASSPAFDASPDSTRAALTPALPSPLPPPLPLPTSEPLPKRPRTEPPRADSLLFSLDTPWSPTFTDDAAARAHAHHSMTAAAAAAAAVDRPFSAITRVGTPARSPSPLAFLSAFGKTPSPPAFPLANSSNFFQRFPPTPHIDLPSPFDVVPSQQTDSVSLARGPFTASIPPMPDPLRADLHQAPMSHHKHESSPLTAPSLNIMEPINVPEPLALPIRVTTTTTTTTGTSGGTSEQASRKGVKCEICGLIFAKRGNKQRHIQTVHNGLKKFRCDVCGNQFGLKADLNRHKFRIHESRSFCCDKCGKSFSQQMQLDHHIRVTHLQDNRPWECKICFLRLGRKSSLTRHEQTVHQKTRFACRVCPKSYSQKFDAVRHERRVHGLSHDASTSTYHRS